MTLLKDKKKNISYCAPGEFEEARFEKIHNIIFNDSNTASKTVANEIASLIIKKQENNETCVLGLATGSSPIKVYEELVRLHKEENLSFYNVITFNLDEYYPMNKKSIHSYHHFMNQHLFDHIDIPLENINIPNGEMSEKDFLLHCIEYEEKINKFGIDFLIVGIGRTGHVGFNEPGSHYNSVTRKIILDHITREDAASSFKGIENVPNTAITMGIKTINKAKRIVLLAWGQTKASIIKKTIEGKISSKIPATYLQQHTNTSFVLDTEAASHLTRIDTPWVVGSCDWNDDLMHKAIVWLSNKKNKPVLHLTDKDYNSSGMSDLLSKYGSSYDLNIKAFNRLQHNITGWPGGKPNADDTNRPERALPKKKRVLVFSPHPDDDVISMGGTIDRLVSQGHEVHIAYQTSGNIAVADYDALKVTEIASKILSNEIFDNIIENINKKTENDFDSKNIRNIKKYIRRSESYGATRFLGIPDENVNFLDLPFYETGTIKKNPLGDKDIMIMKNIIKTIKPHQIYAAGDLADPHGTHKVCLDALTQALDNIKNESFMKDCWVWLYRGAWLEWEIHEMNMVIPLSPSQVLKKRKAIFFHQSQKNEVMFRGADLREFWVRVEDRNKETANKYKALGLANYASMEGFVRYHF